MSAKFIDASAIVAIIIQETSWAALEKNLSDAELLYSSPTSIWEATIAISRVKDFSIAFSNEIVAEFCDMYEIQIVPIDENIGNLAIAAFAKYGKGRHKAKLNFGDCFSYACAKYLNVGLIYVGDDFDQTDLAQK